MENYLLMNSFLGVVPAKMLGTLPKINLLAKIYQMVGFFVHERILKIDW